jgi:LmbE family N-acetylglucosaminyl deacetylase
MVAPFLSAAPLSAGPWKRANWLILAPHADDETLGAGALIAYAASQATLGGVVYLTDGSASHGDLDRASRVRLIEMRKLEASLALRRLAGPNCRAPHFLGWRDAAPFQAGDAEFEASCHRLAALCQTRKIDAIAVTAGNEPHCDHEAACRLAYAVAEKAHRPLAVFEYLVWADARPSAGYRAYRTPSIRIGRRRLALTSHRSQMTPILGAGFRLPAAQIRMAASDVLYTLRSGHAP